jgi:hypothetical protein
MNGKSTILADVFAGMRPGRPLTSEGLTILPFTSTHRSRARYVLLGEAISKGGLVVTEVSAGGAVPHLLAINKGPWPVLIFDGEELVGAKQNRIANTTILVHVGESILPVSCVEHGRWSSRSQAFAEGRYASHPKLRRDKEQQVRASLADAERVAPLEGLSQPERASRYRADQSAVWDEVAEGARDLGVASSTGAMADVYERRGGDLESIIAHFTRPGADGAEREVPVEGMVGAAVFLDGAFLCFDALWPAKRFAQLYPKLLRGYALEALRPSGAPLRKGRDPEAEVLRLFAELAAAEPAENAGADLGVDVRAKATSALCAGLRWEKELVQLSVFAR